MNLVAILEVAIGIILVWFLLSMLVSTLQEALANLLKWRSRDLEKTIQQMLHDPAIQEKLRIRLGDQFYEHPLIHHLGSQVGTRKPSYIPAGQFAEVLLDLVLKAGTSESPVEHIESQAQQAAEALDKRVQKRGLDEFRTLLAEVETAVRSGLMNDERLKPIYTQAEQLQKEYPALKEAVQGLLALAKNGWLASQIDLAARNLAGQASEEYLRPVLKLLVNRGVQAARDADSAVATVRRNLEGWFNDSMDRLSGQYKRRTQLYAFIIGVLAALLLNVDTLTIFKSLWFDQTIRAAIVTTAQQTVQEGSPAERRDQSTEQIVSDLQALPLPIGWKVLSEPALCTTYYAPLFRLQRCLYPAGLSPATDELFRPTLWRTLLGILITGVATMQGSPFWFDLLSKIINMRGAGQIPAAEKDREKPSGK